MLWELDFEREELAQQAMEKLLEIMTLDLKPVVVYIHMPPHGKEIPFPDQSSIG